MALRDKLAKSGIGSLISKLKPKPKPKPRPGTSISKTKTIDPRDSFFPVEIQPALSSAKEIAKKVAVRPKNYSPNVKQAIGKTALYGGVGAGLYGVGSMLRDDEEDTGPGLNKKNFIKPPEEESSDKLGDILREKTMTIANEAGRETPVFFDYVKAFPSSYQEKISRDPEFAKQMMAGFLAMMQPSEGFVPRNAISDFGQAAMAEEARQEAAMTDQEQLLEMSNEDIDRLQKIQRGATPRDATKDASEASAVEGIIKEILYGSKASKKDQVYDKQGNVLSKFELLQIYRESDGDINIIKDSVSAGA